MILLQFSSGETIAADFAATPEERRRGLARQSGPASMLFDFGLPEASRSMTMQGMLFALDFFFVSSNGVIVGIVRNVMPSSKASVVGPACRYVLETPVGFLDVELGDAVWQDPS